MLHFPVPAGCFAVPGVAVVVEAAAAAVAVEVLGYLFYVSWAQLAEKGRRLEAEQSPS